jgi:hypothetical protein
VEEKKGEMEKKRKEGERKWKKGDRKRPNFITISHSSEEKPNFEKWASIPLAPCIAYTTQRIPANNPKRPTSY